MGNIDFKRCTRADWVLGMAFKESLCISFESRETSLIINCNGSGVCHFYISEKEFLVWEEFEKN